MNRPAAARAFALVLSLALLAAPASIAQTIELVQTVPVETDLAEPDVRHAKDVWLEMVKGAQKTIDIGQFYVANEPDSALEPVLVELERAAERGVRLRLILSDKMLKNDRKTFARFEKMKGAEVVVYDLSKVTGGIIHAKYWIVDGETVFVGSQNFDWRALSHIHEMGVLVKDRAIAAQLGRIFETDLAVAASGKLPEPAPAASPAPAPASATAAIELVASPPALNPPGVRPALDALLELLAGAKKKIRIQLLDYTPVGYDKTFWPDLDNALRSAAVRGVKVEMLVSHWNTARPAVEHLKSLSLVPNVSVRIATIPEHSSGFIPYARVIHSKYMVVDDETLWIGTSNWSKDYFRSSRNVELIVRRKEIAAKGVKIFERLWSSPCAAPIDVTRSYPKPRKGE